MQKKQFTSVNNWSIKYKFSMIRWKLERNQNCKSEKSWTVIHNHSSNRSFEIKGAIRKIGEKLTLLNLIVSSEWSA